MVIGKEELCFSDEELSETPLPPLEVLFVEDELDASLCMRNRLFLQRFAQHGRTAEEDAHFAPADAKTPTLISKTEAMQRIFRHLAKNFLL